MPQTFLTIRVDQKLKRQAQRVAKQAGVPLSVMVKASLRKLVSEPVTEYCQLCEEGKPHVPSKRLIRSLKQAEKDREDGWVSPTFDNVEDSLKWLNDPKRKYVRELHTELYKK